MIALYVASTEPYLGKTLTCVTLGKHWQRKGLRVGYFKPLGVVSDSAEREASDEDAGFVARELDLDTPPAQLCPIMLGRQACPLDEEAACGQIMEGYAAASDRKDVVLVGGSGSFLSRGAALGLAGPVVSEMLGAKILLVARCESYLDVDSIVAARRAAGSRFLGVALNRVPARQRESVEREIVPCLDRLGVTVLGVLPDDPVLRSVSVQELTKAIGGEMLVGSNAADELIENFVVGAMGVDSALRYFRQTPRKCVITGGDRSDVQLAALETPTRCLILTGGFEPNPAVLGRAHDLAIPVVLVREDTLTTVSVIEQLLGRLRLRESKKIDHALGEFESHLNLELLDSLLGLS